MAKSKLKKSKVVSNLVFNIIALISTIVVFVFCVYIYKLDMLPNKYLYILFGVFAFIYLILLLLTLPRKMKTKFKVICSIFFIVFALVCGYGIKYSDKTIEALDKINYELVQKEDYEIKTLKSSKFSVKDDLNNAKIGVFKNNSYDEIIKTIERDDIKADLVEYSDPVKLFEDLSEKKIDAVVARDNVYELLEEDLSYLKLDLKNVHTVGIPISGDVEEVVKVVDVTNTKFNIFIAGGDKTGSINKVMNTDVNMVVSVDPVNHKLLFTSIPRDYYVNLPSKGENAYDKLTHAGYYGVQESIKAVEKLLDIDINYYAKVNFTTIEKVVDAIGGIDVKVDKAFTTSNGAYHFNAGMNHMNGAKALRFARERKVFSDGDVQRVKNQQKVIDAVIKKMTSSTSLLTGYTEIMDAISANFATNLDRQSISRLIKMQLADMRGWESIPQNLVGSGDMSTKCYSMPGWSLYIMKQNADSVKAASEKIKEFMK